MNIAIIPARGGSKRIPKKNIKMFHGKPIIAWSIEAALGSQCFDKIIVSTDDDEIADVACQFGAEVPFKRPQRLSDDHTGIQDVVKHTIEHLTKLNRVDFVCCIFATAPFLRSSDIQKGLEILKSSECKFAFSVTKFCYPIQRAIKLTSEGKIKMFFPEYIKSRTQDLEDAYHDAGQFYWGRAIDFCNSISLFSNAIPISLPRYRVQDIDTLEDWENAELMFEIINKASQDEHF